MMRLALATSLLAFSVAVPAWASENIFIPHIIAGSQEVGTDQILDYFTRLEFINFTDQEIEFRVFLTADDGEPLNALEIWCAPLCHAFTDSWDFRLAPLGTKNITVRTDPTLFDGPKAGWARINLSQRGGYNPFPTASDLGIVVSLTTGYRSGEVINSTTILPEQLLTAFSAFARFGSTPRLTAIAFLNPSTTEAAEIDFRLFQGSELFAERTTTLPPRTKLAQFLDQGELFVDVLPPNRSFIGALEVQSSLPLAVTIVQTDHESWSTFRPFPPRNVPGPTTRTAFPAQSPSERFLP